MNIQGTLSDESIESIIGHYSQMVYRLAFARVGNKYDADEVFRRYFCGMCAKILNSMMKSTARLG